MRGAYGALFVAVAALIVCCKADPHRDQDVHGNEQRPKRYDLSDYKQAAEFEELLRFLQDYESDREVNGLGNLGGTMGRNTGGLGGSSLLGRSTGGLGGSSLIGRTTGGLGGSSLVGRNLIGNWGDVEPERRQYARFVDSLGGGNFVRNLDSIGGGNFVKKNLDQLGGPNLVKRNLDSIGGGNFVRNLDSIGGGNFVRHLDPLGGGNFV